MEKKRLVGVTFSILIGGLIFLGCNSHEVNIRIKNNTQYDMYNVSVNFRGHTVKYGDIKKGDFSEYYKVDRAYRYAYVEWEANKKKCFVRPIDYVGEKELKSGYYTYVIVPIQGEEIYHSIELRKD